MNTPEAKMILMRYRPGCDDPADPEVAAALAQVRHDPELAQWFAAQQASQATIRDRLQRIAVPANLKDRILEAHKPGKILPFWPPTAWLAAAAVIGFLVVVATVFLRSRPDNEFAKYQNRLVRAALREYHMDVATNDLKVIQSYLAQQGSPSNYQLPKPLESVSRLGCKAFKWHNHPVSMICFDRGQGKQLWFFVINRQALANPPNASQLRFVPAGTLMMACWTAGENTYVLAAEADEALLHKYL